MGKKEEGHSASGMLTSEIQIPTSGNIWSAFLLAFLLLGGLDTIDSMAQTPEAGPVTLELIDWEFSAGSSWLAHPDATALTGRFRGQVPLESLLPQTTPDSYIQLLSLAAGRNAPDQEGLSNRNAWHLTVLDLSLQRAWWSGSVTLIDLASHVFEKQKRTWFETGTGPGFHVQQEHASVSAKGQVFGGIQSTQLETADGSNLEGTGFHAGVRLSAALEWQMLTVLASWQKTGYSSGHLSLDASRIEVGLQPAERWRLGGLVQRIAETGPEDAMNGPSTRLGMQLTYRLNGR